jgi:hypothetical protein
LAFHAWRRLASHQKDNVVEMKTEITSLCLYLVTFAEKKQLRISNTGNFWNIIAKWKSFTA